jgi:hypothetical protein
VNWPTGYGKTDGVPVGALMPHDDPSLLVRRGGSFGGPQALPATAPHFLGGDGSASDPYHYDRIRFTGAVHIGGGDGFQNAHVLFTNCFFEGSPSNPTADTTGDPFTAFNSGNGAPARVRLEECTVGPNATAMNGAPPTSIGGTSESIHTRGVQLEVIRCDVWGSNVQVSLEYPIDGSGENLIENNYFHDAWVVSPDHYDVVNGHDPGNASHVRVTGNFMGGWHNGYQHTIYAFAIYDTHAVTDWELDHNYVGWSQSAMGGGGDKGIIALRVHDNVFITGVHDGSQCGDWTGTAPTTQSGNVDQRGTPIADVKRLPPY